MLNIVILLKSSAESGRPSFEGNGIIVRFNLPISSLMFFFYLVLFNVFYSVSFYSFLVWIG